MGSKWLCLQFVSQEAGQPGLGAGLGGEGSEAESTGQQPPLPPSVNNRADHTTSVALWRGLLSSSSRYLIKLSWRKKNKINILQRDA